MAAAGEPNTGRVPSLGDALARLWAAATCWTMAALFVVAWWWPRALDNGRWVKLGVGMMALEFVLVHSEAVLGAVAVRKGSAGGAWMPRLALLYAVFGVAIALAFRSWEIVASFAAVMSGRFWSARAGRADADLAFGRRRAAASIALYVLLTFASVLVPVPRGGITPQLLDEVWRSRGSGVWERRPEAALAMGAAYFLILGVIEATAPASAQGGKAGADLAE